MLIQDSGRFPTVSLEAQSLLKASGSSLLEMPSQLTKAGYWVPFEAAKAVAARLCYRIRYVLVPVFGPDFVSLCSSPKDSDFENLSIDRRILRQCKDGLPRMRGQLREPSPAGSSKSVSPYDDLPIWPPRKSAREKKLKSTEAESGYGTDTDRPDMSSPTPGSPMSIGWTPVNTPRIPNLDNFRFPPPPPEITSYPWVNSPPSRSLRVKDLKRPCPDDDVADEETSSEESLEPSTGMCKRRKVSPTSESPMTPEMEAASTLIQLSIADRALSEEKKGTRRRRASA